MPVTSDLVIHLPVFLYLFFSVCFTLPGVLTH